MTAIAKAEVRLNYTTDMPRDVAINTFHFACPGDDISETSIDAIFAQLDDFYNTDVDLDGDEFAVKDIIAPIVKRTSGGCEIRIFDAQADPSPVVEETAFTLLEADGTPDWTLPLEVAITASLRATPLSVVPRARRTGRIYIGPVMNPGTPSGIPRIPQVQRDIIAASCQRMAGADVAAALWGVYSRVDDAIYQITQGWVDNDYDTQRRRQVDATARSSWTV